MNQAFECPRCGHCCRESTTSVEMIRENPDGSADYMFNFPPEAMAALTRLGILTAIQAGIDEAKKLNPDQEEPPTEEAYEAAKQREWVGLTDKERYLGDARSAEEIEYARAIEAKLKEKNNG